MLCCTNMVALAGQVAGQVALLRALLFVCLKRLLKDWVLHSVKCTIFAELKGMNSRFVCVQTAAFLGAHRFTQESGSNSICYSRSSCNSAQLLQMWRQQIKAYVECITKYISRWWWTDLQVYIHDMFRLGYCSVTFWPMWDNLTDRRFRSYICDVPRQCEAWQVST